MNNLLYEEIEYIERLLNEKKKDLLSSGNEDENRRELNFINNLKYKISDLAIESRYRKRGD